MNVDQCTGCLLGLALGDAFGADHEGGPLERLVWRFIGRTKAGKRRWTDDTQMAMDVARWLLDAGAADPDALAIRFGQSYRWSRGYGPGAARILKRIARGEHWSIANRAAFADGSFGNGAAMRAPVVGLFYAKSPERATEVATVSAKITHAHSLGIEGAVLLAAATGAAVQLCDASGILERSAEVCESPEFTKRLDIARDWLRSDHMPTAAQVARQLGNSIAAPKSCVTALYVALRHLALPFQEMMEFAIRVRGDVDTIGAMSGAIWGARRGTPELPDDWLNQLEDKERIERTGAELFERAPRFSKRSTPERARDHRNA